MDFKTALKAKKEPLGLNDTKSSFLKRLTEELSEFGCFTHAFTLVFIQVNFSHSQ